MLPIGAEKPSPIRRHMLNRASTAIIGGGSP